MVLLTSIELTKQCTPLRKRIRQNQRSHQLRKPILTRSHSPRQDTNRKSSLCQQKSWIRQVLWILANSNQYLLTVINHLWVSWPKSKLPVLLLFQLRLLSQNAASNLGLSLLRSSWIFHRSMDWDINYLTASMEYCLMTLLKSLLIQTYSISTTLKDLSSHMTLTANKLK